VARIDSIKVIRTASKKTRIDPLFAFLILLTLGINLPYLKSTFFPIVDTLLHFHIFYHFYNELFYHGHIAGWFPYGAFGMPADFLFLLQTEASYFFMAVGALFRITNALALFKGSIVFEQLIFLTGLYLLSRRIFKTKSAAFAVCVGAVACTVWYSQIFFNFLVYYLLPFALFFLISFFEDRRPESLWMCGIVCIAWTMDGVYGLILCFYLLAFLCVFLSFRHWPAWKSLLTRRRSNLIFLALFLALAGIFIYYRINSLNDLFFTLQGRDAITKKTDLQTFMTFGGNPQPMHVLWCFLLGWPTYLPNVGCIMDNTLYIGLLPLAFFIWALFHVRSSLFWGVTTLIALLVSFSFGSCVTKAAYYLPAMNMFRHVGLVYSLVKILILLGAGFGWENFWASPKRFRLMSAIVLGMAILANRCLAFPFGIHSFDPLAPDLKWFDFFIARIAVYSGGLAFAFLLSSTAVRTHPLLKMSVSRERILKTSLILCLLFDILSFQRIVWLQAPKLSPEKLRFLDCVAVNRLEYQPQRHWELKTMRQQQAFDLTDQARFPPTLHAVAYNFVQFDPAYPRYRIDYISPGVQELLHSRSANPKSDPAFYPILGIESPKIRLLSKAVFADTQEEAKGLVETASSWDRVAILQDVAPEIRVSDTSFSVNTEINGTVNVTGFSADEVIIDSEVTSPGGAWLVYADAWHPGWHATVNGKEVPIAKAYLAFKAVYLEKGKNIVRFFFGNGWTGAMKVLIGILSILLSLVFIFLFLAILFNTRFIQHLTKKQDGLLPTAKNRCEIQ